MRSIFGIHHTQSFTLFVDGTPTGSTSPIYVASIVDGTPADWEPIAYGSSRWSIPLDAGSYAIKLLDADAADDPITITVSENVILATIPTEETEEEPEHVIYGALEKTSSVVTEDPKDPWPPPPPPPPYSLSSPVLAWLDAVLIPYAPGGALALARGGEGPDRPGSVAL